MREAKTKRKMRHDKEDNGVYYEDCSDDESPREGGPMGLELRRGSQQVSKGVRRWEENQFHAKYEEERNDVERAKNVINESETFRAGQDSPRSRKSKETTHTDIKLAIRNIKNFLKPLSIARIGSPRSPQNLLQTKAKSVRSTIVSLQEIEQSAVKSTLRSSIQRFILNDRLSSRLCIHEQKLIIVAGEGQLINNFDCVLYEGMVLYGKLNGKGRLNNTSLFVQGDSSDVMAYCSRVDHVRDFLEQINPGLTQLFFMNRKKRFLSNWVKYEGEFERNYLQGRGRIAYENGAVFEGTFCKGNMEGRGRFSHGKLVILGEWSKNELKLIIEV